MRILFIGGTGNISLACTRMAVERGFEVTVLNRGRRPADLPPGVRSLTLDIEDPGAANALSGCSFDAVVNWIAFRPADIERDLRLFQGRTRQYVFISSASVYQKPATHYLITESTPLANPFWEYSRNKIACEERLIQAYRDNGFPATIVRPSHTYGDTQIALAINSWTKSYTVIDRMRRGRKVIVPGDGTSLWVITHNTDFAKGLVGLLGNEQTVGHSFHITTDEVMCWISSIAWQPRPPAWNPSWFIFRPITWPPACPTHSARSSAIKPSAWFSITAKSSGSFPVTAPPCRSRKAFAAHWHGLTPTPPVSKSTPKPMSGGTD